MSRLTVEDVEKAAKLSRLSFTADEARDFADQLGRVLGFVEKLNELDTEGVEPAAQTLPLTNVMREDLLRPSLPPEAALANAPESEAGCFKVPPIIQES